MTRYSTFGNLFYDISAILMVYVSSFYDCRTSTIWILHVQGDRTRDEIYVFTMARCEAFRCIFKLEIGVDFTRCGNFLRNENTKKKFRMKNVEY